MESDFKYAISGVVLLVCLIIAIAVFGRAACVADKATFGAIENELDRKNFEQSQSYREGLRRDFDELIISYSRAKSDDERATILAVMRHRAAGAPPEAVPADVKKFIADHTSTQK